jgi:hypothetical protein
MKALVHGGVIIAVRRGLEKDSMRCVPPEYASDGAGRPPGVEQVWVIGRDVDLHTSMMPGLYLGVRF